MPASQTAPEEAPAGRLLAFLAPLSALRSPASQPAASLALELELAAEVPVRAEAAARCESIRLALSLGAR